MNRKYKPRLSGVAIVLLLAPFAAPAQDQTSESSTVEDVSTAVEDSDLSDAGTERHAVSNDDGFGGPKTIGAQLERDNTAREYRLPVRVFADWFEHKKRINDDYGIQLAD